MDEFSKLNREPMLEMFIFETNQLLEQLEEILLKTEKKGDLLNEDINEIFRNMHTIKGSAAMMMFNNISSIAHSVEDLFYFIRENKLKNLDYSAICDLVLISSDFIRDEIYKISKFKDPDGSEENLVEKIREYLSKLKGNYNGKYEDKEEAVKEENTSEKYYFSSYGIKKDGILIRYKAKVYFDDDCQMENIRAFTIVHNLRNQCEEIFHIPKDIIEDNMTSEYIKNNGFQVFFSSYEETESLRKAFQDALFVKSFEFNEVDDYESDVEPLKDQVQANMVKESENESNINLLCNQGEKEFADKVLSQDIISVNINRLDKLMNIVGEIVITESMVTKNPDLKGLRLDSFNKAARQLNKLTTELQDMVMAIRMVPVSLTFNKMKRIVRDMCKKLDKEIDLEIIGGDTEVDKNIIDQLSDPLMHIIRNSIDHGIESREDRIAIGKSERGKITLEAKSSGGDVWILIKDDGQGLDKDKILSKGREKNLIFKPEIELTDKDIYSLIMLPGFSTNENVTEFSGRGVGMDVVRKNIEKVGGTVIIESNMHIGTTISLKIPLTLAIIDGMEIAVGKSKYTIPIAAIRESFKPDSNNVIEDSNGNEMIMIRGQCYPILRIHKVYKVETAVKSVDKGILVMVEGDSATACIFADKLLGEQQVVVKALPRYIKKVDGLAGCTILGDGSISLILDVDGILEKL